MKDFILYSLFVLTSLFSWGQKANVVLSVESEDVMLNQPFSISLKSNVEGDVVENWPSNFIKGQGIQSMSRYVQDVNTGKMVQEHILVFTGTFTKVGKYKLGPIYVKSGNKTYQSNTIKINVIASPNTNGSEDFSRQQLRQPAFGAVEVSATKIYEGEPLLVSGRVYARERTYGRPVLRRPYSVDGVTDVYPLQQTEMWESVVVKNRTYESFSFEKKVLFPIGSGTLTIQPFEIYLPFANQDYNVSSSVPTVEVLPLPADAPNEFIGAVGVFDVMQHYKDSKVKQGDIVKVDVVIAGTGNLHAIEIPKLPLPKGMNIYGDAEIKEDYVMTAHGASGKITYTYFVQVINEGAQKINPVKIAYFNPKTEDYVTVAADHPIIFDVKENANFDVAAQENGGNNKDADTIVKSKGKEDSKNNNSKTWIWVGAGGALFLAGVFLFLFFKPKSESKKKEDTINTVVKSVKIPVSKADALSSISAVECLVVNHQSDEFYAALDKSLMAIMKYKLQIPNDSNPSRSELISELHDDKDGSVVKITELFSKADTARYGLGISEDEQKLVLDELKKLI